jgi:hypothetical protein
MTKIEALRSGDLVLNLSIESIDQRSLMFTPCGVRKCPAKISVCHARKAHHREKNVRRASSDTSNVVTY